MQARSSYSINSAGTSISHLTHLKTAIPTLDISAFSSQEFVGMVTYYSNEKIEFKELHCQILKGHNALKSE